MLLDCTINFQAYNNSVPTNDASDTTKYFNALTGVTISQASRTQMTVAIGGGYSSVPILSVGGDYLILASDQPLNLQFNGGAQALPVAPKVVGTKSFVVFWKGGITSLQVANTGSVIANIDVIVAKV